MKIARGWFSGTIFASTMRNAEFPEDVILWIEHSTTTDKATNRKYIATIYFDNNRLPDVFYVTQWEHSKQSEKPTPKAKPAVATKKVTKKPKLKEAIAA